ncbi:MAG: Holliday junction ATP-dependent DNA helicase RuvA [Deltaproteobacteria bacterium ADurb.BinA179]|jgi:Holliday junction DNA helicase RuvA|nr:Holliday junction branch migration protein RuvA [Deltaproteobacteria bacterium]MDI9543976.1 Holliday junction branch migration protein RuvA [Pseudomonadota bacterium]NLW66400.1 Holliday junction branch migration protein RuvA [Bacteriovoracaceae bacterium]OPZ29265.1 MAG: Holliday junction ATP-dependent DNA helicase RuvA [Deltaproteobacteria bacterium ADurb.BinA179]HRR21925.1 Holliday junction branch migration protein RuvA [Desulfomonilia bacterium]
MISMLRGEVVQSTGTEVTLLVSGVGYRIHVPSSIDGKIACGEEATFHTMLIARQDSLELYGFTDPRQKEIFSLLLSVSGVGPKTAMNIVSGIEPERFLEEVVSENIGYLSSLPGIGRKSAQRIVLELKERIAKKYGTGGGRHHADASEDAVAALMSLGYAESQARRAVGCVTADNVEGLIRAALKELVR